MPMPKFCPPNRFDRVLRLLEDSPEDGFDELVDLAERYPKDPDVQRALGVELLDRDAPVAALEHLEIAAARSQHPDFHTPVVAAFIHLGLFAHARRAMRRAVARGAGELDDELLAESLAPTLPEDEQLKLEAGLLAILRGRSEHGLAALAGVAARHPDEPRVWEILASSRLQEGRVRAARAAAARAHALDPESLQARHALVHCDVLLHGVDVARDHVRTPEPADVPSALTLAETHAVLNDFAGVEWALDRLDALLEDPEDLPSRAEELRFMIDGWREDTEPGEPIVSLQRLAPWLLEAWISRPPGPKGSKAVQKQLLELPGLLVRVPSHIGYEPETFARLITLLLVTIEESTPEVEAAATAVREIGLHGPGVWGTRIPILETLYDLDVIGDEDVEPSDLADLFRFGYVEPYRFPGDAELGGATPPLSIQASDELAFIDRMGEGEGALSTGDLDAARRLLAWPADLHAVHPWTLIHYVGTRGDLAFAEGQGWLAVALAERTLEFFEDDDEAYELVWERFSAALDRIGQDLSELAPSES